MATRVQKNACLHPHSIDAQTRLQPSLFTGIPTVRARVSILCAFPEPWVLFLIFNAHPSRRAKLQSHVSILFLFAVCMVCCLQLGWACASSGYGGCWHSGRNNGTVVSGAMRVGDTRWHKHSWTNMFTPLEPALSLTLSCLLHWLLLPLVWPLTLKRRQQEDSYK